MRIERTPRGEIYGRTTEDVDSLNLLMMRRVLGDGWSLTLDFGDARLSFHATDADLDMLESVLGRRRWSEASLDLVTARTAEGAEVAGDD